MQYRELGKTHIKVSEVGFGAWAIGGAAVVAGVPIGFGRASDDESLAAIRRARDLGVTFFDTADSYGFGRSESLLGIVLSRTRHEVVIATKVGVVRDVNGLLKKDFSKQHIFDAVNGSLKRLRTDYVDVYQLHNPSVEDLRRDDIHEAMDRLQEVGKIRFWGVSVTTPEEGLEIVNNGWGYTLQVLYNVLNQAPARELFPLAKEKGYGIIARVPLASGLLSGKFRTDTTFAARTSSRRSASRRCSRASTRQSRSSAAPRNLSARVRSASPSRTTPSRRSFPARATSARSR
jgi:aryl-alcohol dehydrogenase-like predicted oxidoreductase